MELLNEWDGKGATLRSGIDTACKFVRIAPGGYWTPDDVHRFHHLQKIINDVARTRYGILKIVMDLRHGQIATAEVSEMFTAGSRVIYHPADRIAVITQSALLKMQLKRAFHVGIVETFTSDTEAEAWLDS